MCPIVSFFLVWIHKINLLVRCPMYIVFVSIAGEKPLDTYLSEKYPGVTLSEDAMDKIKKPRHQTLTFASPKNKWTLDFKTSLIFVCIFLSYDWKNSTNFLDVTKHFVTSK